MRRCQLRRALCGQPSAVFGGAPFPPCVGLASQSWLVRTGPDHPSASAGAAPRRNPATGHARHDAGAPLDIGPLLQAQATFDGAAAPQTQHRAVVIAHGLMGSSGNWMTAGPAMAGALREAHAHVDSVWAVDMRNHGRSPHAAPHSTQAMVADMHGFLEALAAPAGAAAPHMRAAPGAADFGEGGRVVLVGHSMGGIAVMAHLLDLANRDLAAPDGARRTHEALRTRVAGAVIVDVCPVRRPPAAFAQIDRDLGALRRLPLTPDLTVSAAERQLQAEIADPVMRQFLLTNLIAGSPKTGTPAAWRCNLELLAGSLDGILFPAAPDDMFASGGQLDAAAVPTMFVFGESSTYNTAAGREAIGEFFPGAEEVEVAGAGHYPHFERRAAFTEAVVPFIQRCME